MKAAIYSSAAVLLGVGAALAVYAAAPSRAPAGPNVSFSAADPESAGSSKIAVFSPIPAFGAAPPVRGVAVGLYHDTPARPYATQLRELKALGATHVALVVHWFQTDVRSLDLAPDPVRTVSDRAVAQALDAALALGLRVFFLPIVQLEKRTMGEWRGTIAPPSWDAWWARYERFILHYAALAGRHGASMFCVGSELVSTESQRERWSALIAKVRARFGGELVYSANWDAYSKVSFWELLGAVGVSGYFEIAKDGTSVAAMRTAWTKERDALESYARTLGKGLVLTEVGYPSIHGGARWPWHYTRKAAVDVDEQARAYRAFIEAWQERSLLRGVFLWNWEGEGGPEDSGYTLRGKPAEALLRAWFATPTR